MSERVTEEKRDICFSIAKTYSAQTICFNWPTQTSVGTFRDARTKWAGPSLRTESKPVALVASTQTVLVLQILLAWSVPQFRRLLQDSIAYQRPISPLRAKAHVRGIAGRQRGH